MFAIIKKPSCLVGLHENTSRGQRARDIIAKLDCAL